MYLLHTNCPVETCAKEQVLGHYKNLLDVEEAFCQLKSYLEVRPIVTIQVFCRCSIAGPIYS